MKTGKLLLTGLLACLTGSTAVVAGWSDYLDQLKESVKIPMPDSLSWVEKSLRTLHQDELADEFFGTMNHATEQAVPEAAAIFGDAIQDMSVEDMQGILTGPDDAATQYFRSNTKAALTAKMPPLSRMPLPGPG